MMFLFLGEKNEAIFYVWVHKHKLARFNELYVPLQVQF